MRPPPPPPTESEKDLKLLGLDPQGTWVTCHLIKAAWRVRAEGSHPDNNPMAATDQHAKAWAEKQFKDLKDAYERLAVAYNFEHGSETFGCSVWL
jgi:hypothetical protein